jgi:hypothetical protein
MAARMVDMATASEEGEDADQPWPSGLEREPPLGAHLTTSRRGYTHHGMYVGDGRVVHYSGLSGFWQCGPVEEVSLTRFAAASTSATGASTASAAAHKSSDGGSCPCAYS